MKRESYEERKARLAQIPMPPIPPNCEQFIDGKYFEPGFPFITTYDRRDVVTLDRIITTLRRTVAAVAEVAWMVEAERLDDGNATCMHCECWRDDVRAAMENAQAWRKWGRAK